MLEGKDVLVVEDDPIFRNMIVGFLNSQGCQVREADDGLDGLRALRDAIPDILLCDLSMPVMTGMEFVEEIAAQYPMVPVIVISGTGDMADVANALRHGVKDFLIKPLDNIMVLKSAMLSVLKSEDSAVAEQDFSNNWFNIGDDGVDIDEELEWHIKELQANPKAARELLLGLMPETESRQGDWQLNYCVLQAADVQPVLLDYTWLMDGRLAFYLVDSAAGENSTATTLLIRAFFNDYLRTRMADESDLNHLVRLIEKGMHHSGYASPIRGIFGIFDACDRSLQVLSSGLGAVFQTSDSNYTISTQAWLGQSAANNRVETIYLAESGGRLSLSEIGSASFSVTIKRCNTR
ncbi:two-component system response regulator [Photobacterium jeanii]|uniref:Two-component system response regulator n=1 Tax=Photobacterium jeanii TaxID=858640 RepID=A0A178K9N1_9GAMM|nr:response regulator [Photobacterium jeanii]OAN13827.1 two-component system response regulator [Photobacterium jeanii]PST88899.1 two-component system response regulator [Photobacterium jeanii]